MAPRISPALLLLAIVACRRPPLRAVEDASRDASAEAGPPSSTTVLLGGDLELRDVLWASNGDVIATTGVGLLRFAPEIDAPATMLRLPEREAPARVATARHSDVVAIVTASRKLFVARDGGALRPLAEVGSPASVDVSDDGKLIAVDEPAPSGTRTAGLHDAVTGRQLRTFDVFARFDASSRFVASSTLIAAVDGSSADIPLGGDQFLAWVAGRAALAGKNGLVLVEPATRETKRLAMCGDPEIDVERSRAVAVCTSPAKIEIVSLPGGERTSVPLPASVAANVFRVSGAPEGDDLLLQHGTTNREHEIVSQKLLRVDVLARRTEDVPLATTIARDLREGPTRETASLARPPHGRRTLGAGSKWPLVVRDVHEREIARWGPASSAGTAFAMRVRERGLDLEPVVERGVAGARANRTRVGPPASPASPAPDERTPPIASAGWVVLDARPDTILVASQTSPVTIRFTGADGATRTTGTIGDGASCTQGRIAIDGRSAGISCTRAGVHELVELDLATGKETRRTRLTFPSGELWTLEAVGKGALVFSPPRFRWRSPGALVLEAGTGRRIAEVLALADAAVARFEDGAVEIFGEAASAERAIRCEQGGVLRPFAACRAQALVTGRFVLDL